MSSNASAAASVDESLPISPPSPSEQGLTFTPRGTVGGWYTEECDFQGDQDPGPSSSTYGPDLWKARRAAWLSGALELNPPAPKVHRGGEDSDPSSEETMGTTVDPLYSGGTSTPTSFVAPMVADDGSKPVLSAIQSLSAKARGKLPSFLHLPYSATQPAPTTTPKRHPTSPATLSSLEKLELLMAEPGAEENEKVWRQGGLEAVWRMLTESKTLKQPMRLGLVIQILKAGWIRDGTWPSALSKDGKSRRAVGAVMDDPFFSSPPPSPVLEPSTQEQGVKEAVEKEVYRPPKKL